jgi:hypothetical protein
MKMLEDLAEVVRLSDRATSGTVELHTSCSWRRIVSGNRPFLVPTVDPDGHANMDTTESAEFVVSLVNWFRTHHATIRDMAARLEAAERDAVTLTDGQCDAIYAALSEYGSGIDHYEFGLPWHCDAGPEERRKVIRKAAMQETGR